MWYIVKSAFSLVNHIVILNIPMKVLIFSILMFIFNVLNGFAFGFYAFGDESSPSTVSMIAKDCISLLICIVLFALLYIKSKNHYVLNCLLVYLFSEVFGYSVTYLITGELFLSQTLLIEIVELAIGIYVASLIGAKLIKLRRFEGI